MAFTLCFCTPIPLRVESHFSPTSEPSSLRGSSPLGTFQLPQQLAELCKLREKLGVLMHGMTQAGQIIVHSTALRLKSKQTGVLLHPTSAARLTENLLST